MIMKTDQVPVGFEELVPWIEWLGLVMIVPLLLVVAAFAVVKSLRPRESAMLYRDENGDFTLLSSDARQADRASTEFPGLPPVVEEDRTRSSVPTDMYRFSRVGEGPTDHEG